MSHLPKGFSAVTVYLLLEDPDGFLEFARAGLGATERFIGRDDNGRMTHGEISIEGCVIELGQPGGDFQPSRTSLHIFVEDPDAVVDRAVAAGATLLYAVTDHDYGERSGGVADAWGNQYYFARVIDHAKRSPNA